MATLVPRTWAANEVLTAANMNLELRDNMLRTETALADTAGAAISNSTAEDELVITKPRSAYLGAQITYTRDISEPFWATGLGPKLVVPAYTNYLVFASARIDSTLDNSGVYFGITIDGEDPSILDSVQYRNTTVLRTSMWRLISEAPTGSPDTRTIEISYGVAATTGNTGIWAQRLLTVIPLG